MPCGPTAEARIPKPPPPIRFLPRGPATRQTVNLPPSIDRVAAIPVQLSSLSASIPAYEAANALSLHANHSRQFEAESDSYGRGRSPGSAGHVASERQRAQFDRDCDRAPARPPVEGMLSPVPGANDGARSSLRQSQSQPKLLSSGGVMEGA